MSGRVSLAVVLAAATLLAPSAVTAATQIGQTAPPPASFTCGGSTAFLQESVAPSSPSYTVPAGGGVITSWSTQAANSDGKDAELKLFHRHPSGSPDSFVVRGQDGPHILTAGVLNTFPVKIPVQGGEILGLYYTTSGTACEFAALAGDLTTYQSGSIPSPPIGSTYTRDTTDTGYRVNVSALLEPDCDKDGLGDDTQDTNVASCLSLRCGGQRLTMVGTKGPNKIVGTKAQDVIAALAGNDKVSGLAGNDLICGGSGKDTLNGGKGKDKLLGEAGKDTLKGGPGKDKLKGGAGKDKQVQ